jgi:hypothetical protein
MAADVAGPSGDSVPSISDADLAAAERDFDSGLKALRVSNICVCGTSNLYVMHVLQAFKLGSVCLLFV